MLLVMHRRIKVLTWSVLMLLVSSSLLFAAAQISKNQGVALKGVVAQLASVRMANKSTRKISAIAARKSVVKSKVPDAEKLVARLKAIEQEENQNIYPVINRAYDSLQALVNTAAQGGETSQLMGEYTANTEAAKNALTELEKLTNESVDIVNATSKDQQLIAKYHSDYAAWAKTVDMLVPDPRLSKDFEKKVQEAYEASAKNVESTEAVVKTMQSEELTAEEKQVIVEEVIPEGQATQNKFKEGMEQFGVILAEIIKIIMATKAYGGGGRGFALGLATVMAANALSGDSPFKLINATKKLFKIMGENTKKLNTAYNGYMQATGELAGVKVEAVELVDPDLPTDAQQETDVQQE